ncbi:MAG: ATP-binding protein [Lachnospiraceae bacterium]
MRKKIQRSMILVFTAALLISYVMFTVIVYRQTVTAAENELKQEADYIRTAVRISGAGYLKQMDAVRESTRVTLISSQGQVLYDSHEDEVELENHGSRPEVRQAFENGEGSDTRSSDTIHQEMMYYAILLEDGSVLRVSKNINTAFYHGYTILPTIAVQAVFMLILTWALARWQAKKLVQPMNLLNLEEPLNSVVYEELVPFLERIDTQNKEKRAVADMRKEFSANVSHELKTPLTSISGYAELMKNGLVKPEDMKIFSERIYSEASRLIVLIEDIIKLSRLDEEEVDLEKEEVDLFDLTREVAERLYSKAAEKGVRIEVTGERVKYKGIRQVLDEMIYNLCDNAIKYNKNGGKVTVWAGSTLKGIKVVVSDTGIGIPEDQRERIFERFYRVDKSHSKESGGTGLGLSIVKHGALLHGAVLKLESEPGRGTRIEIDFGGAVNDREAT